jgi:hypothetical protein
MIRSGANGLMPLGEDPVDVASSDSARSDPDVVGLGTSEGVAEPQPIVVQASCLHLLF